MADETTVEQGLTEDTQDVTAVQDKRLSDEAAKWRTKFRELEAQVKDLAPKAAEFDKLQEASKTETQRINEQLASLQAQIAAEQAKATAAQQQATLLTMAAKAGVDPDTALMLDISKIDLTDEAKALQQLSRFAKPKAGAQVNPASNGTTDDELRKLYFGGGKSKTMIFGG